MLKFSLDPLQCVPILQSTLLEDKPISISQNRVILSLLMCISVDLLFQRPVRTN